MKIFVLVVVAAIAMSSCSGNKQADNAQASGTEAVEVPDMHNAQNSLDYYGIYEGILPAADCPGIQNTLTLNKDNTFTLHGEYLERNTSYDDKGTYTLDGNILTLKTDKGETSYYKVGEGQVRMLGADKQEVTGPLAEHYILKQTKVF